MPQPQENLLIHETSPYLRQHKDNPVHWRPWSAAALAEAAELNRPILLSVGYSACHWCHVMAHECFEDEEVAAVMNDLFVNIKVDREERPDIDQIYMAALSATGEQGGWPLTMFLTPEAKPFWGGTYFPKEPRYGRPGFVAVLRAVHEAWVSKADAVGRNADVITDHVSARLAPSVDPGRLSDNPLHRFAVSVAANIDPLHGGLKGAPKFPNAPFMNLLWLSWLVHGETTHRDAFLLSLSHMLNGGIYDHLAGGLSRYSTDAEWMVPHFEKMLYDNALMIRHALWAYRETGAGLFRRRIEQTVRWLLAEMRAGPAFASSMDADSEGEEGRYYVWSREEIQTVLGDDAGVFFRSYGLGTADHWEGNPVIYYRDDGVPADAHEMTALDEAVATLAASRETRVRPGRDDKILTDWNGLAIRALAEAGKNLGEPEWVNAAEQAFRFVIESRREDGWLPHSQSHSNALFAAISSDYASMINAAISLYETTADETYRHHAIELADMLDHLFGDGAGGHYLTTRERSDTPMRIRGDVDEAVPSATAQIVEALARLSAMTGEPRDHQRAVQCAEAALGRAGQQSHGQAGIIASVATLLDIRKLVIAGPDTSAFVSTANRFPDPRRVDLLARSAVELRDSLPGGPEGAADGTVAYYCQGQICLPPFTTADGLAKLLSNRGRLP